MEMNTWSSNLPFWAPHTFFHLHFLYHCNTPFCTLFILLFYSSGHVVVWVAWVEHKTQYLAIGNTNEPTAISTLCCLPLNVSGNVLLRPRWNEWSVTSTWWVDVPHCSVMSPFVWIGWAQDWSAALFFCGVFWGRSLWAACRLSSELAG